MFENLPIKKYKIKNYLYPFSFYAANAAKYVVDIAVIVSSYWLSYFVRFEGSIPLSEYEVFCWTLPVFIAGFLVCNLLFGLTKSVWRYASLRDIEKVGSFVIAGTGLSVILGIILTRELIALIPRSIYIINSLFVFLGISGVRLLYRIGFDRMKRFRKKREKVLIIGDRDIAASLQYSILKDHGHQFSIVGFISFDKKRLGTTINTIPVIGILQDVPRLVAAHNITYIFIAVDSATNQEMKHIIKTAQQTEALVRIVPSMVDVVAGNFSLKDMREIRFEDYLERNPVEFDLEAIKREFFQKKILVTGGGGSVGSAICKELAQMNVAQLVIVDISEDNLFRASNLLAKITADSQSMQDKIVYKLMDIRDVPSLERVFQSNKFDYIIHAAARKHVPLSEDNPHEVVSTNIVGTLGLMRLAQKHRVDKFVYISTDKAVEPVSIMGATKRVGELLVTAMNRQADGETKFMAVRFGNVVGSSGNVIEVFTEQLLKGEAITITDEHMERYFMSLNEAIRLILQSICMGKGGEIFVLDMGRPVKIKDLAYDIALFYGKNLKDGDIRYVGRRKGEKLTEKLTSNSETKIPTNFAKIFKVEGKVHTPDIIKRIEQLNIELSNCSEKILRDTLFSLINNSASS